MRRAYEDESQNPAVENTIYMLDENGKSIEVEVPDDGQESEVKYNAGND